MGDDGRRYRIKPLNNAQGQRVPVTEQIVGRAGTVIGAPTCEVRTISISQDFAGWEFKPGHRLQPGIAHASLQVEGAVDTGTLDHRLEDDNVRRHAFLFALHDWCWGSDTQGLLAVQDENRFYSHDHGYYLPPDGPTWTIQDLEAQVDAAHELTLNADAIDRVTIEEVADAMERVHREELLAVLAAIPVSWPATDDELECVGFFLERRTAAVAARLRQRVRGVP